MSATNVIDWIWLQEAIGVNGDSDSLLDYFGTPENIRRAGEREWRLSGLVSGDIVARMSRATMDKAQSIYEVCRKNGWRIITPDCREYPALLRSIPKRPCVLYAYGTPEDWSNHATVAVVGARNASRYGEEVARCLCTQFAQAGAVVVSGGALGIDSAAHRGAINGGGKTVAFLGCGLGNPYLSENKELRRLISENGVVYTEYSPFTPPTRGSFPVRNRLIAGMSAGTLVIEAGEKSGSLITARWARDYGRNIFAVPGDIVNSAYTGANKLIRDGAIPAFCCDDVLNVYKYRFEETLDLSRVQKINISQNLSRIAGSARTKNIGNRSERLERSPDEKVKPNRPANIPDDEEQRKIFTLLSEKGELHVDEISAALGVQTYKVLSVLTLMELSGYIEQLPGRRYILKY